jgi:serine/threonine-protein kinase
MPARRIGRYELLQEIGRGAMGTVHLARDTALDRKVAIKLLSRDQTHNHRIVARFEREGRAIARISSEHVVKVYEAAFVDGDAFIAMELVTGGSVEDELRRAGRLEWRRAVRYVLGAAWGLAAAHEVGIFHRDVKPANLLLDAERRVKVTDFGIARLGNRANTAELENLTRTGAVLGTPAFFAPETLCGSEHDARSDLYSLGVTLYELVTGKLPFDGENMINMVRKIPTGDFVPPSRLVPDLPREVERLCLRLMARDPKDRPENAAQAIEELTRTLTERSSDLMPLPGGELHAPHVRRGLVAGLAGFLVLAGVLAVTVLPRRGAPPSPAPLGVASVISVTAPAPGSVPGRSVVVRVVSDVELSGLEASYETVEGKVTVSRASTGFEAAVTVPLPASGGPVEIEVTARAAGRPPGVSRVRVDGPQPPDPQHPDPADPPQPAGR